MAKKRYADGGEMDDTSVDTNEPGMKEAEPEENFKPTSFKDAFASARKAGDKTFMWKGKSFTTDLASAKKPASTSLNARVPVPEPVKPGEKKLKYQSLQDRKRDYEAAREKSGVSMYGVRKSPPREPLPTASDQAYKKGGVTASKRADGIAQRGKTRGKMV